MQRRQHQTELAGDEVDDRQDADDQQPRETSRLHRPSSFTRHLDRHFGMPQNSRHLSKEIIQVLLPWGELSSGAGEARILASPGLPRDDSPNGGPTGLRNPGRFFFPEVGATSGFV